MKRLLFVVLLLTLVIPAANVGSRTKHPMSPSMLQASERLFERVIAMAIGIYENKARFYVFHAGSFAIYNEEHDPLYRVATLGNFYPTDPVVDSEGNVFFIDSATDEIAWIGPTGKWGGSFRVQEKPYSLALLSNGNVVIASPNDGKLLHVYDTSGHKLRSFGNVKLFDRINDAQNLFLNRGKVVVDPSDKIFFVFKYSPSPVALAFSRKGNLVSEFGIDGSAIDYNTELARKYLDSKPLHEVGGIVVTNSATVDPSTGHLWICMDGSSRSGLVYEYSQKGKKLREYAFGIALPGMRPFPVSSVTDLIVRSASIYLFGGGGVYSVSSNKALPPGGLVFADVACPQQQPWSDCLANCPQGSCPDTQNCKAALQATVGQSPNVTGSTCQSLGPSQGTPAKPNGGCVATVTTCNTSTGIQTTTTANLDCNAVKYKCNGGDCITACDGTFSSSTCNSSCTGGAEGGGGGVLCTPCIEAGTNLVTCECNTPILIDVSGNGFDLTNAAGGVNFDLNSDGIAEHLSWTKAGSDEAFLALDRDGNGRIDNGTELFGNFTPQPSAVPPNGFHALAEFDKQDNGGNGDGQIDRRDTIFSSLRLWQDTNHNGVSEPSELHTLRSLGVYALDLDYRVSRRRDQEGNWFRYRARVYDSRGTQVGRWAWDVIFLKD
ncbi:MAG: hypothetical protein AABO41_06805 [Acidobacteriota bacterium]